MAHRMLMLNNYVLRYDQERERPWIIITFTQDGEEKTFHWYPPAEDAVYIADLLRNEKPVYWCPEGKFLSTSREIVGEGES